MLNTTASYDLAIFQLVIYVILTPAALLVLVRHGWSGIWGWFFLLGFLTLQLVAAGLAVSAGKDGVSTIGITISSVGLSPLILAIEGILSEIYRVEEERSFFFKIVVSIVFHVIVIGAAALYGSGSGSYYSSNPSSNALGEIQGGMAIFIVTYLYLAFLVGKALFQLKSFPRMRWLLLATAFTIPVLALRIVFSSLFAYDKSSSTFNPVTGNLAARILMQVLPVMFVSAALVCGGLATIGLGKNRPSPQPGRNEAGLPEQEQSTAAPESTQFQRKFAASNFVV